MSLSLDGLALAPAIKLVQALSKYKASIVFPEA